MVETITDWVQVVAAYLTLIDFVIRFINGLQPKKRKKLKKRRTRKK